MRIAEAMVTVTYFAPTRIKAKVAAQFGGLPRMTDATQYR